MRYYVEMRLTTPQTNDHHKIVGDLFILFLEVNGAGTLILLAYQDVRNQSQQNLKVDDGISCCPADFCFSDWMP